VQRTACAAPNFAPPLVSRRGAPDRPATARAPLCDGGPHAHVQARARRGDRVAGPFVALAFAFFIAPAARWGSFEVRFVGALSSSAAAAASPLAPNGGAPLGTFAQCFRVSLDLGSTYVATTPPSTAGDCGAFADATAYTDERFAALAAASGPSAPALLTMLASKKAGAACYFYVIALNALLLGLAIASAATTAVRLSRGEVKKSDAPFVHGGCCGCGGGPGGLGDPCTAVALAAVAFGLTLPVALIAWPATMGICVAAFIAGLFSAAALGVPSLPAYALGAGYAMAGAGVALQLAAMIAACVARDAFRAHAYSGAVRGGAGGATTVVVVPPSGLQMAAAGYGAPQQAAWPPPQQAAWPPQQQPAWPPQYGAPPPPPLPPHFAPAGV